MEKEYYYLDEKEQKGPFTIDQLKTVGLKPDTLVWTEDFDNWKQVKEVEELKFLLKKTPPPPPIVDISTTSQKQIIEDRQDENRILVEDSNVKFLASFKIYTTIIVLFGIAVLIAFLIISKNKQEFKKEIYSKIDDILDGKTVILDGNLSLTQGDLEETGYNSKSKVKNSDDPFANLFQKWWEREKIYTVYKATNGGFTIKQLTKQNDDGYDIETSYSGDMGYKKPASRYVQPEYFNGYEISGGYYSNNYRLSVRECYREAFEYFTKEDKKSPGAYSPGKFVDISNFPDIRNKYFYMDNTFPKKYSSSGVFSSSWESTDEHGANINTEDWAVYYKTSGKHYEIIENKETIYKDLFFYLGISVGFILFLLIITLISKPKYFKNLNLFGKRWKNTSYHEQVFFFEHSFFKKHTFTEIINEKVSKGILKFTDRGNTLNLSYPSKELFYKIESIDKDNLMLVSIKDSSIITFIRIGAKEIKETKTETIPQTEHIKNEETNQ